MQSRPRIQNCSWYRISEISVGNNKKLHSDEEGFIIKNIRYKGYQVRIKIVKTGKLK